MNAEKHLPENALTDVDAKALLTISSLRRAVDAMADYRRSLPISKRQAVWTHYDYNADKHESEDATDES